MLSIVNDRKFRSSVRIPAQDKPIPSAIVESFPKHLVVLPKIRHEHNVTINLAVLAYWLQRQRQSEGDETAAGVACHLCAAFPCDALRAIELQHTVGAFHRGRAILERRRRFENVCHRAAGYAS